MIYILGTGVALFLGCLLFGKKHKTQADRILALWMLFVALDLYLFYHDNSGTIFEYFLLLHGPFLFFYVQHLIGTAPERKWVLFLHFIPAVISYAFHVPFYIASLREWLPLYQRILSSERELYYAVTFCLVFISGSVYITLSSILMYRHRKAIANNFSSLEKVNLNWVIVLISGIFLIFLTSLIPFDGDWYSPAEADAMEPDFLEALTGILVVAFVTVTGYFGINQTEIFSKSSPREDRPAKIQDDEKYKKSRLTEEAAADIEKRLLGAMKTEKHYLNGDITLGRLAQAIEANPAYVSQVINDRLKTNFCDFVNRYRVEEFKARIDEILSKKENILSLAFGCGFNSKSQFNMTFKKQTGTTPREFIRSITPV